MRKSIAGLLVTTLFCCGHWAQAADADATAVDAALQGTWVVTAAEQGGKPFDVIKGGRLQIAGNTFDLLTAAGNRFAGTLRTNSEANPRQIDFLLDTGVVWLGIYAHSGTVFRYNYVEGGDGAQRPTVFATTADTPGTVIVMRKQESP